MMQFASATMEQVVTVLAGYLCSEGNKKLIKPIKP